MRLVTHTPNSPYQLGDPPVHVLISDGAGPETITRVLYVLPVETLDRAECGNALQEVAKLAELNRPDVLCVKPTFSHAPWYADHPREGSIRQESHLLKVVLPFIEQTYLAAASGPRTRRLLLGFSKSGWGAYSLLLRHPDVFQKAAVFDAPLAWESPNRYGMAEVFGTQENMNRYCIVDLLAQAKALAEQEPRLALYGYSDFRGQHQFLHYHMLRLGIPHLYQDGPRREHRWDSGWLPPAVGFLLSQ